MEWTNDRVLEFLELYEKEPIIWDASNTLHKNRNEVYDAWLRIKISFTIPCSVTDLKKKKESLMSSFRTCLNKIKQSTKSGAGADEIFKPNWFAFETMARFLRNKDQPKESINSEDIASQLQDEQLDEDVTVIDEMNPSDDENAVTETELPNNPTVTRAQSTFKVPPKKKTKTSSEDRQIYSQMQEAYSIMKTMRERLLATKLRAMDERTRDIVMHEIDNVVFRVKMAKSDRTDCNLYPPALQEIFARHQQSSISYQSQPISPSCSLRSSSNDSHSTTSHSQQGCFYSNERTENENPQHSVEDITAQTIMETFK